MLGQPVILEDHNVRTGPIRRQTHANEPGTRQPVAAIGDGKSLFIVDASQMRAIESSAKRFEEYVSLMAAANRHRGVLPSIVKRGLPNSQPHKADVTLRNVLVTPV